MEVPPSLKSLAPYIRLSKQFEARDPVVSYYCKLNQLKVWFERRKFIIFIFKQNIILKV